MVRGSGQRFESLIAKALADEGNGVIAVIKERDGYSIRIADELESTRNIEIINVNFNSEKSISNSI